MDIQKLIQEEKNKEEVTEGQQRKDEADQRREDFLAKENQPNAKLSLLPALTFLLGALIVSGLSLVVGGLSAVHSSKAGESHRSFCPVEENNKAPETAQLEVVTQAYMKYLDELEHVEKLAESSLQELRGKDKFLEFLSLGPRPSKRVHRESKSLWINFFARLKGHHEILGFCNIFRDEMTQAWSFFHAKVLEAEKKYYAEFGVSNMWKYQIVETMIYTTRDSWNLLVKKDWDVFNKNVTDGIDLKLAASDLMEGLEESNKVTTILMKFALEVFEPKTKSPQLGFFKGISASTLLDYYTEVNQAVDQTISMMENAYKLVCEKMDQKTGT